MAVNAPYSRSSQPWSRYQTAPVNRPLPPGYCVSRPNGVYTPLIPADEIPLEVNIPYDYPRTILSETEARQWNLKCVGQCNNAPCQSTRPASIISSCPVIERAMHSASDSPLSGHDRHQPALTINSTRNRCCPEGDIGASLSSPDGFAPSPTHSAISHPNMALQRSQDIPSIQDEDNVIPHTITSYDSRIRRPLPPSGIEPDLRKKEFCQFWIRHGQCDFMQQGCLYKHEMPPLPVLKDIMGLNSFPRWWVEERIDNEKGSVSSKRINNKAQRSVAVRQRNLAAIGSERQAGILMSAGLQTSKYAYGISSKSVDPSSVHLIDLDDESSIINPSGPSEHPKTLSSSTVLAGELVGKNSSSKLQDTTVVKRFVDQDHSTPSYTSRGEIEMINEVQRARAIKEAKLRNPPREETTIDAASDCSQRHTVGIFHGRGRKSRRGRKFSTASRSSPSEVSTDKASR